MATDHSLPKTHRALVLKSTTTPPSVESVPTPQPTPGSAVVRILAAGVIPYMREIYDGTRSYAFPTPLVIGCSAVGRVAAVGPDATKLSPGQLVLVHTTIRSRDDPTGAIFLAGVHEGFTDGSRKLMHGEWRDATFAEYAKVRCKTIPTPLLIQF
jgi:NADPH:quinone reductase-like Zn-dependent oxidoreductase